MTQLAQAVQEISLRIHDANNDLEIARTGELSRLHCADPSASFTFCPLLTMRRFASNPSGMPDRTRATNFSPDLASHSPDADSRAQAVLATLLDSLECGVLLLGPGGDLWAANDRFAAIVGMEPERLRELKTLDQIVDCIAPRLARAEGVVTQWLQRFRACEPFWDEWELAKPEKKIVERYALPVLDRYKQPLAWMEIHRDVTSRRQIESRLFHSERLATLGQMVSGIAHELNNALTSIFGYAQLLRKRTGGFQWEGDAQHIVEEGDRARRIAQNLLFFARGSKGECSPVNLNEIVQRTVQIRAYELRLADIKVELDLDEQLPELIADPAQIQQCLLNLIVNAEQAIQQIRESGHIWIRTKSVSGSRVGVEIADDGPGVPPEVTLRVFDPFFTTKPAGVGTGLGLSILYAIVRQHGGEVFVENRLGGGALFRIELPSAANSSTPGEKPYLIRGSNPEAQAEPKPSGSRFLVVEDEPTVAQLIVDVLSEEGHRVDMVLDSREGLNLARSRAYDLLICDLRMPHIDGRALYRQLRNDKNPLRHRLIFVTGDTLAPRTVDFLQRCGVPYLAKPFLVDELKEVVARTLGTAEASSSVAWDYLEREPPRADSHSQRRHWKRYES